MFVFAWIKLTPRSACLWMSVFPDVSLPLSGCLFCISVCFLSAFLSVRCCLGLLLCFQVGWSVRWRLYCVSFVDTALFLYTISVYSCVRLYECLLHIRYACPLALKSLTVCVQLAVLLFVRMSVNLHAILYVMISIVCCLDVCPLVSVLSACFFFSKGCRRLNEEIFRKICDTRRS